MDLSVPYDLALSTNDGTDLQRPSNPGALISGRNGETLHTLRVGLNFPSQCYERHRFHCRC